MKQQSIKGWNWGWYHMKKDEIEITHDKEGTKTCFSLKYKDIAVTNAAKDSEVSVEFQDSEDNKKGDILCEMRFYVPNIDEKIQEDHQKAQEIKNKEKQVNKDKKKSDQGDDEEMEDEESEENDEDRITPAMVFNEKIQKYAGLGDTMGELIATFSDIPLMVPRGKYSMDLYQNYVRFHGRTHDYKILYKDIAQLFQLPRVDRDQTVILFQLSKPLIQGQTMHHFLLVQLDNTRIDKIKVNMSQDEISKKYGSNIESEMNDNTYIIMAKLFKFVGEIEKIIVPGDFKSAIDGKSSSINCSVKVSDGFLYPMKSSLIFIQKPIIYIKHKEINYVQFQRVGKQAGGTGRSFDIQVYRKDNAPDQFKNIDKNELKVLMEYFKKSGIQMRSINTDKNQEMKIDDLESDEIDEEIKQSQTENDQSGQKVTIGRSGRMRVQVKAPIQMDEDDEYGDDDSEDGSFNSNIKESGQGSDSNEEGEEEMEDDIDDDEIDKDELALMKSNPIIEKKKKK